MRKNPWSCHPIEHQMSAVYNITHGLGLAIVTPRWMEFVLDENNAEKFCRFGKEVFSLEIPTDKIVGAKKAIECLKDFFFNKLSLPSTLSEIGIGSEKFDFMAENACGKNGFINGWKKLFPYDVKEIYSRCL